MWRLAILAVLAGCLDLSLPAAQRAGSVAVTALVPDPASPTLSPATTAELELIGSGLSTRATEDGNLLLGGITQTTGTLALSATLPSGERFERRFDVAASGIGPGRSVSLGVVTLSRGATITGVVRRPALPNPTGHAGVQVFLPGSPRTTFSADDGFYALGPVPQGQLSIGFFTPGARVHFEPVAVAGSGEVRLGSIQLEPDAKDAGVQSGFRVSVVDEAGAEIGEGVVRVLQATGTIGGAINAGIARVDRLTPGLSSIEFESGDRGHALDNVFLGPGETDLGRVALSPRWRRAAGPVDAGRLGVRRAPVLIGSLVNGISLPIDGGAFVPPPPDAQPGDLVLVITASESTIPAPTPRGAFTSLGYRSNLARRTAQVLFRRAAIDEATQTEVWRFESAVEVVWLRVVLREAADPVLVDSRIVPRFVQLEPRVVRADAFSLTAVATNDLCAESVLDGGFTVNTPRVVPTSNLAWVEYHRLPPGPTTAIPLSCGQMANAATIIFDLEAPGAP